MMNVQLIERANWRRTNARTPATSFHVERDLAKSSIMKLSALVSTDIN